VSETDRNQRPGTGGVDYTSRLERLASARWKRFLATQAPYRWHIRRLNLGRTLDVGCGLGRNLSHLNGAGVGVDHNPSSVAAARARGLEAYTVEEFFASERARPDMFDAVLAAHLLEHLSEQQGRDVIESYLPYVKRGGKAVFITPQQRGYASDATHVRYVGFAEATKLCHELGMTVQEQYSFPFPKLLGPVFTYNEYVTVARLS
jgi:SAM-dependent methyltransferase